MNENQSPQSSRHFSPSVGERLPEEKNQMKGFLQQLNGRLAPASDYGAVVRELLLEQIDNAEYLLLHIDSRENTALYAYLMGMVFWYRGYQAEAGQQFQQAAQSDPQNDVFQKTYQYQWNPQPSGYHEKRGKGAMMADCCCDCADCIRCCSNCSSCLGSR